MPKPTPNVTGPGTESQLAAILAQVIRQCAVLDTMVMYHTRCQRSRLLLTGPGHHSCQSWSDHLPQRKDMITTSDLVIKSLRFDGHVKRNRQWNFVFFSKSFCKTFDICSSQIKVLPPHLKRKCLYQALFTRLKHPAVNAPARLLRTYSPLKPSY